MCVYARLYDFKHLKYVLKQNLKSLINLQFEFVYTIRKFIVYKILINSYIVTIIKCLITKQRLMTAKVFR